MVAIFTNALPTNKPHKQFTKQITRELFIPNECMELSSKEIHQGSQTREGKKKGEEKNPKYSVYTRTLLPGEFIPPASWAESSIGRQPLQREE